MTYSFKKSVDDLQNFEKYIQSLLEALPSYSNNPIQLLSSSAIDETNVINLNFPADLTLDQYAILEKAITSYIEPISDEKLYRTRPSLFTQTSIKNNTFTTINSILNSGSFYGDELNRLRVNSRIINSTTSNNYYYLRVVDITNNVTLGSNILNNEEYQYNTIPLSNVSSQTATLELQGKNVSTNTHFDINSVQLAYIFR